MNAQRVILILSLALLASFARRRLPTAAGLPAALGEGAAPPMSSVGNRRGEAVSGRTFSLGQQYRGEKESLPVSLMAVSRWSTSGPPGANPAAKKCPMLAGLHASRTAPAGFKVVRRGPLMTYQQARDFAAGLGVAYTILVGSTRCDGHGPKL